MGKRTTVIEITIKAEVRHETEAELAAAMQELRQRGLHLDSFRAGADGCWSVKALKGAQVRVDSGVAG